MRPYKESRGRIRLLKEKKYHKLAFTLGGTSPVVQFAAYFGFQAAAVRKPTIVDFGLYFRRLQ